MFRLMMIIADLIVICTTNANSTKILSAIGIAFLALSLYLSGKNGD